MQHVARFIVGILLRITCTLCKARQLPQRVIDIGTFGGFATLCALFARDVPVLVVAVAERDAADAAGCLLQQVAHTVVAICGCQAACARRVAGLRLDSSARFVVGVGSHFAVQPRCAHHAVHGIISIPYLFPIGISHGNFVAVLVVSIGNYIPVYIRHGDQVTLCVVLIGDCTRFAADGRDHSQLVIVALDSLSVACVLRKQAAGLVIIKCQDGAIRLGHALQPAFGRISILHRVAQRICFAQQVAMLVVGVARDMAQRVRNLGDAVQRVIGISGLVAQLVDYTRQVVHLVVIT